MSFTPLLVLATKMVAAVLESKKLTICTYAYKALTSAKADYITPAALISLDGTLVDRLYNSDSEDMPSSL
jgi:hypothetical protein